MAVRHASGPVLAKEIALEILEAYRMPGFAKALRGLADLNLGPPADEEDAITKRCTSVRCRSRLPNNDFSTAQPTPTSHARRVHSNALGSHFLHSRRLS